MISSQAEAQQDLRPRLILPPLRPQQRSIIVNQARELVLLGSTQGVGKTYALSTWALAYTLRRLKNRQIMWWATPTLEQGVTAFDLIFEWAGHAGVLVHSTKAPHRLYFHGGRRIEFRSWERDDNLLGPSIDALVVDQAELLTPRARAILSTRRSARLGPARYSGNASVAGSEFHRLWLQAIDEPDKARMDCVKWTWRDYLAVLPPAHAKEYERFIEEERKNQIGTEFERLYEAVWAPPEQAILAGVIDQMATAAPSKDPHPGHEYVIGWDIGATHDYVVGAPLCIKCWTVTDILRFRPGSISGLWKPIRDYSDHWNHGRAVIETNGMGRGPCDDLMASGYPCVPWCTDGINKRDAVFEFVRRGSGGSLTLAPIPVILEEARVFQSKQSSTGSWTFGAPAGAHDDTVMALLIALGHCTQGAAAFLSAMRNLLDARKPKASDAA